MRHQKIRQPTSAWDVGLFVKEPINVPVFEELNIKEPSIREASIREPVELKAYLRFRVAWNNVKYVLAVLAGLFTGTGLVYLTLEAVIAIFVLLKRTFGG